MATEVSIGYGSTFGIGDGAGSEVFTDLAEVTSVTPGELSAAVVDATHMGSDDGWRDKIVGLLDAGTVSITMNWVPGSAAEAALLTFLSGRTAKNCKITYPGGEYVIFKAFCTKIGQTDPLEDKMTSTADFTLTGKPAFVV